MVRLSQIYSILQDTNKVPHSKQQQFSETILGTILLLAHHLFFLCTDQEYLSKQKDINQFQEYGQCLRQKQPDTVIPRLPLRCSKISKSEQNLFII